MTTPDQLKAMAVRLRAKLEATLNVSVSHSQSLELVAGQLGYRDWNTCVADVGAHSDREPVVVPILRTFPGGEADKFYLEYLGFSTDWEHRFSDDLPLYRQVSRGNCVLHLSEHHGDATPGFSVRIEVPDVAALREALNRKPYLLRPGLEKMPWGSELVIPDPFGTRLVFHTPGCLCVCQVFEGERLVIGGVRWCRR